jgi:hypothetical protein
MSQPAPVSGAPRADLPRVLGFTSVVGIQVGTVIGSGIFVAPNRIAGLVGSPQLQNLPMFIKFGAIVSVSLVVFGWASGDLKHFVEPAPPAWTGGMVGNFGAALVLYVSVSALVTRPVNALAGLAIIGAGVPAYAYWRRSQPAA